MKDRCYVCLAPATRVSGKDKDRIPYCAAHVPARILVFRRAAFEALLAGTARRQKRMREAKKAS